MIHTQTFSEEDSKKWDKQERYIMFCHFCNNDEDSLLHVWGEVGIYFKSVKCLLAQFGEFSSFFIFKILNLFKALQSYTGN